MAFTGHEVAPASVLKHALDMLLAPDRPDPAALADCRAQIEAEVAGKLDQVEKLIAGGRRVDARSLLRDIDARFGGMAAPKSSDLYAALGEPPP